MTTQYEKYTELLNDLAKWELEANETDPDESLENELKHRLAEFTPIKRKTLIDVMTLDEVRELVKIPRKPRCPKVGGAKKKKQVFKHKCSCLDTPQRRNKEGTGFYQLNNKRWPHLSKERTNLIQCSTDFVPCETKVFQKVGGRYFCRKHFKKYMNLQLNPELKDDEIDFTFKIIPNCEGRGCYTSGVWHDNGGLPIDYESGRWGWSVKCAPADDTTEWEIKDKKVEAYLTEYLHEIKTQEMPKPRFCWCKNRWNSGCRSSLKSYLEFWAIKNGEHSTMKKINEHFKPPFGRYKYCHQNVQQYPERPPLPVEYVEEVEDLTTPVPEVKEEQEEIARLFDTEEEEEEEKEEEEPVDDPLAPESSDEEEQQRIVEKMAKRAEKVKKKKKKKKKIVKIKKKD